MMQLQVISVLLAASAVSAWQPISTNLFLRSKGWSFQEKAHIHDYEARASNSARIRTCTAVNSHQAEEVEAEVVTTVSSPAPPQDDEPKLCYYKHPSGRWRQRIELKTLKVGQEIVMAERIGKADLLSAKTGPKIFFECGVGRIDAKGNWQMVSGMLRLGKRYMKPSVVRKKIAKLAGKPVSLYVRKVRLETGELEVVSSVEALERELEKDQTKVKTSASSLTVGQELVGKVIAVRDYGCIVDVGANRNGLLHIQKVADLYGRYIAQVEGLEKAGLERGAEIRVAVASNESKRLFLDFTTDIREEAEAERRMKESEDEENSIVKDEDDEDEDVEEVTDSSSDDGMVSDEEAMWAAYSADDYDNSDDEDRDIEDALGLGSY